MVNAESQHVNQFLEDSTCVSLSSFIIYLFHCTSRTTIRQFAWDSKEPIFLPTKLTTDTQFFYVFCVYPNFLMYLAHQLRLSASKWCILSSYWINSKEILKKLSIKSYIHYSTTSHSLCYYYNWHFLFTENFVRWCVFFLMQCLGFSSLLHQEASDI